MTASAELQKIVLDTLPRTAPGIPPREVHARVSLWSRVTIRGALRELVRGGMAVADGPECQRLYRRRG